MKIRNISMAIALMVVGLTLSTTVCAASSSSNVQGATANDGANAAQSTSNTSNSDATVLIDPAKIYNENPMGWVGRAVILQNVTVEDTNNSGAFWIGSDNDHRILVVKQPDNDNLKAMSFHKGDVVTITGTVEAASRYMAQEKSAESGSMHDAQKTSGVFVLATKLYVASSTHK
jgi:hypothetical protein